MAPAGIRELFTGEGDWRRLPCADEPWSREASGELARVLAWTLAAAALAVDEDDERRCLTRYEAECERGRAGLCVPEGEDGKLSA